MACYRGGFRGDQVQVSRDPQDPANVTLEPGAGRESYRVLGIGPVFLVGGVLLLAGPIFDIVIAMFVVAGAAGGPTGRHAP